MAGNRTLRILCRIFALLGIITVTVVAGYFTIGFLSEHIDPGVTVSNIQTNIWNWWQLGGGASLLALIGGTVIGICLDYFLVIAIAFFAGAIVWVFTGKKPIWILEFLEDM
jgi:hypothetical protein